MSTPDNPAEMSLLARLVNIFATPGDVFDSIKARPVSLANAFVPLVLSCAMGIVFCLVVFSQESILHEMRRGQEKAMDQQVKAGKMTRAQADQSLEMIDKFSGPKMMMALGSLGSVFGGTAGLFLAALLVWLLAKFAFKSTIAYGKAMEIVGLASMISVLGGVVKMLLVLVTANVSVSAGPALLIDKFNPGNRLHAIVGAFDIMTLWYLAVLAIGVAKVTAASFAKTAGWLFGIWLALTATMIGISSLLGWIH